MKTFDVDKMFDVFRSLETKLHGAVEKGVQKAGEQSVRLLKDKSPVASGNFKDSWGFLRLKEGVKVFNSSDHAIWVERKQHILRSSKAEIRKLLKSCIKDELRQVKA